MALEPKDNEDQELASTARDDRDNRFSQDDDDLAGLSFPVISNVEVIEAARFGGDADDALEEEPDERSGRIERA